MEELFQQLTLVGPGWAAVMFVATVAGGVAWLISHRQYLRMMRAAHAEQVKLKDETIVMLEAARQQAIATLEHGKADAIKERDVYRDKLHEEKAHHQATLLRLTELESRPDLGQILKLEREFHSEKMEVQNQMLKTLQALEKKIDDEHKQNTKVCMETAKAVESLVRFLVENNIIPKGIVIKS